MRLRFGFAFMLLLSGSAFARASGETDVSVDPQTGVYEIVDRTLGWKFAGKLKGAVRDVQTILGGDVNGAFIETTFIWTSDIVTHVAIRCYQDRPAVQFSLQYRRKSARPIAFPDFTTWPRGVTPFSYRDSTFAPASYSLNETSTPWLFFNSRAQAFIFSPASQFMIAKMVGDGEQHIGASLNERLKEVPNGLEQDSLLVFGQGIAKTWDMWGQTLRGLYNRKLPDVNSDLLLSSFGYWTDNGADYYYNYEPEDGYAGTLLKLRERYRQEGIPLAYLQLDSWWYQKSTDDPAGKPGGSTKNSALPAETWNRYGGTMEYRAHPALFPKGLSAFQKSLSLPLAVHARWIDRKSPYHDHFKISGVGVVDRRWWNETADYLASSGVVCYEQDWLDRIYDNSPEMASTAGVADAFTDGMFLACRNRGLEMQYCMASPRFFLQGVKYSNLTTIRTSGDRFEPGKWASFLYTSQLASAAGEMPWCDVFKSHETGNMILAVLSAGPVGTGDAIGKEDKANILKAVRPDGIIVKPDHPMVACDQTYTDQAGPFLASTHTDHGGYKTNYFFAFPRAKGPGSVRILPVYYGINQDCYLFDLVGGVGRRISPDDATDVTIGPVGYAYFMIVPVGKSGIALFGDLDKFVPTGKQRIAKIEDGKDGLRVDVGFARGEGPVKLQGTSPHSPHLRLLSGKAALISYDAETKRFVIEVEPGRGDSAAIVLTN